MKKYPRRNFIKMTTLYGMALAPAGKLSLVLPHSISTEGMNATGPDLPFIPHRVASWWCTIEDLQWPQKNITEKIKRRAAAFAEAHIDTAINFGFHVRFDFSNYFRQLHGYYANVCEELHRYNIKFMDHYSCNHVERPRGDAELRKLSRNHRHHTLLFHDPQAAVYAQYEGHFFNDLCETDLRNGNRGYAASYQFEIFCHNNPGFLDMHRKYLERLMKEVPMDGIEVDDMCDYGGATTCGCKYCRERFRKEYGHEIPPYSDTAFWGDTTNKNMLLWGNYDNPVFRDWINMKADSVADHVKMVKSIIGKKPLMTCCSSAGPVVLNMVALNLEKMAPHLDLFMLENVGLNVNSVHWTGMDAEAMLQKDIADKRGAAPAMALCYSTYSAGGYVGWGLSRFWGVAGWASTENQGLEEDPADAMEIEDIMRPYNTWELQYSDHDYRQGKDLVEVRLVSNGYCRDNGWRDGNGREHWDRNLAWSRQLIKSNTGYRFVRAQELADAQALSKENTPLILDGAGCISDSQFKAIQTYLKKGGTAWVALPFGTHDEKGIKRSRPLSEQLTKGKYKNLVMIESALHATPLQQLLQEGRFKQILTQTSGDSRWAARIRMYNNKAVIHFMNTAMTGIPHPTIKDVSGAYLLKDLDTQIKDNRLQYELDTTKCPVGELVVMSPETGDRQQTVNIVRGKNGKATLQLNLQGVKAYAVVQPR